MRDVLLFAILGTGAGAAYALTGLGIVVIYKGSGVVNFAQGALLMLAAFVYADLTRAGVSPGEATAAILVGAALVGVLMYVLVMRPLRRSPLLAKVVATIGLLVALEGIASVRWGGIPGLPAPSLFPVQFLRVFGVPVGVDRIYLIGITVVLVIVLWAFYRFTRFGVATRACAENEQGAAFLGFSPDVIAGANWGFGAVLAAAAGILIAPIATLDIVTLTFLVLPAIAAATLGRFTSFGLTALAAMLIGIAQSELTRFWNPQGLHDALPFVVVIVAMAVTGRLIPSRSSVTDRRPPFALPGRVRPIWAVLFPATVVLLLIFTGSVYQAALTTSLIVAIIALSMVVITGYAGQVSLAPMTFAGIGGFAAARLGHDVGIPFPIPILLGAIVAVPVGVIVGAPALRVRGLSLAIVTLGAAVAADVLLFQQQSVTGGDRGSPVATPSIAGLDMDPVHHATRFGIFALAVLCLLMLAVGNLRSNPLGRRMLAVRGNERAAASVGVGVPAVKLQAFALSAAIAAIGGGVLAYQLSAVSYPLFVPLQSLTLVTVAYIGGIAAVSGTLQAGLLASGGIGYVLINKIGGLDRYWFVLTGTLLVATIVRRPDGLAVANSRLLASLEETFRRRFDSNVAWRQTEKDLT